MIELRRIVTEYGGALEVDLRPQGIDLAYDLGSPKFTYGALMRYLEHMPLGSAVSRQQDREAGIDPNTPSLTDRLLRAVEFQVAVVAFTNTDGKGPKPKPIPLPGDTNTKRGRSRRRDDRTYDERWRARLAEREAALARMQEEARDA